MIIDTTTRDTLCIQLQNLRRAAIELERLVLLDQAAAGAVWLRAHALREQADTLTTETLSVLIAAYKQAVDRT